MNLEEVHVGRMQYDDRSRITISGDVANSLKAYGDVDKRLPKGFGD
jgi:hypothetical protein